MNYYCEDFTGASHPPPRLHIGKTSVVASGRLMTWRVYPEEQDLPQNLHEWLAWLFDNPVCRIEDEYGHSYSPSAFVMVLMGTDHHTVVLEEFS